MTDFYDLARTLKTVMAAGQGFALLMRLADGRYHYASIAHRSDVRALLVEWLERQRAKVNVRDPRETEVRARARLKIEATCAGLGCLLEAEGHRLLLFLFDYGDTGHLAYWTNAPNAIEVVENFIRVTA
jgi:hypothetical protein